MLIYILIVGKHRQNWDFNKTLA